MRESQQFGVVVYEGAASELWVQTVKAQSHGAGMKRVISAVISGMCGTDGGREIPALFIPGSAVRSSWGGSAWEAESALTFKYQMKQVRTLQDVCVTCAVHMCWHLLHDKS